MASLRIAVAEIHRAASKDEKTGRVVKKKARRISDGPKKIP